MMTKQEAIKCIVDCAEHYQEQFLNRNLLILSLDKHQRVCCMEAVFLSRSFKHLTGVKTKEDVTANLFFEMCVNGKLSPSDFEFAEDGTTLLKLKVLPALMKPHLSANSVGDYNMQSPKLVTEKLVGSIYACMGFEKQDQFYYPNTVLCKDIRDITKSPQQRIAAIFRKPVIDPMYQECVYVAKKIQLHDLLVSSEIPCQIDESLLVS